jgi:D-glycero-alpha-D-manno-heptose-7-phosphate kinase
MFHLGTSRVSSQIIEEQSKSVNSGASSNFDAMMKIRSEAKAMRELILKGDFGGVAKSLQTGWENKKATSSKVSTPQIDNTYEIAMKSGAVAGKVSGAGGGGYMLFMVPLHNRFNLTQELEKLGGGAVLSVNFTMEGAKAWQVI